MSAGSIGRYGTSQSASLSGTPNSAARLAALRRTDEDIAAMRAALEARRAASAAADAAFVDADIALRDGLISLLHLTGVRADEPNPGDAAHADLVRAVEARDAEEAARVSQAELQETLRRLPALGRVSPRPPTPRPPAAPHHRPRTTAPTRPRARAAAWR
ncbi:hypothetical protein AB0H77_37115 [Streptomyces sp. NPDC050844]|uniref:hypothetical protein n=1 Tax=Streptomyces sp. NPDC050844 TaxID=3155790 RepID=UPI0033F4ABCD